MTEIYDLLVDNENLAFLGEKAKEYSEQLSEAIINVNKAFAGNQYFLSEIIKLEREKYLLKNIYATFNYNSEN